MRFNGTTIPTHRDETYDTSEVSRYKSSSGGGSSFIVTFTQDGNTYSADKTFEEIKIAYLNGETVKGYFTHDSTVTMVFYLSHYNLADEFTDETISFTGFNGLAFCISSNNEVQFRGIQ